MKAMRERGGAAVMEWNGVVSWVTDDAVFHPPLETQAGAGWETAPETPGQRQKVLVVDDEVLIADSLAAILNQSGFEARAIYSGADAVRMAQEYCADILLCDVLMPRINGVEAAIAVQEACPEMRIVLFSGQAATGDILRQAHEQGYDFELLPKPLHPRELLRTLRGE